MSSRGFAASTLALLASASASTTLSRPPIRLATPRPLASPFDRPLPGGPLGPRGDPDYHANVGRCIDALQDDYPTMLIVEPTLDIFSDCIQLVDSRTNLVVSGKRGYRRVLSVMRWLAGVSLSSAETGVLIVFDPIASQIRARWSAKLVVRGREDEPPLQVDGVSLYSLDSSGHICKHQLMYTEMVGPSAIISSLPSFAFGEEEQLERALANGR